jgi:DNA-binding NtrC family response regulator
VPIVLPPLRARREDIPELAAHFLNVYNEANDRYVLHIERRALEVLQNYDWPGNVRELQNYVERAVVMADGDELTVDLLPQSLVDGEPARPGHVDGMSQEALIGEVVQRGITSAGQEAGNLHSEIVNHVERELILQIMAVCNNVQTNAAAMMGINRNTLHKKLKEYGLDA